MPSTIPFFPITKLATHPELTIYILKPSLDAVNGEATQIMAAMQTHKINELSALLCRLKA